MITVAKFNWKMLQIDPYSVKSTLINAVVANWHATLIIKMIQKILLAPFAYTYVYFLYAVPHNSIDAREL